MCALFDARRGEVYAGCYAFGAGGITTILPPTAATVEQVIERWMELEEQANQ